MFTWILFDIINGRECLEIKGRTIRRHPCFQLPTQNTPDRKTRLHISFLSRHTMSIPAFILFFIVHVQLLQTAPPRLSSYDDQVNVLLSKMTDEEKVGQMTDITINVIVKDPTKPRDQVEIDPVKLATAIQDYKVGSIMNVPGIAAIGLPQWHDIITKVQDEAAKSRLKIPILYGIDSIHGANFIQNAVLFPQATALAATFNTSLARELGTIAAHQTRAAGIPWSFHPQVDIG